MMRYRFRVRLIVTLVLTALISAYLAFSGVGNGLYVWVLLVGLAYSLRWLAKNAGELLRSAASYAFLSILSGSLMAFLIVVVVLIFAAAYMVLDASIGGYIALVREYFEAKAYDQLNP